MRKSSIIKISSLTILMVGFYAIMNIISVFKDQTYAESAVSQLEGDSGYYFLQTQGPLELIGTILSALVFLGYLYLVVKVMRKKNG